jgi:hypothetical protein
VVPQLVVDLIQLDTFSMVFLGRSYRVIGAAAILPFVLLFGVSLFFMAQAQTRRSIYLWMAYLMGGLGTLAKGPAGIGMPVLVILLFLFITGRVSEIWGGPEQKDAAPDEPREGGLSGLVQRLGTIEDGLELLRGALIFFCVAAPWYVAMVARHGAPFWMELIGDNYVHRAQGRHGDRGTFEYYLRQLGAGLFPWSGVVAAALLQVGRWLRRDERTDKPRRMLVALCLSWFVMDFAIVTIVNTKFHHYILPALPALAVLAGLFLDELIGKAGESFAPAAASRTALLLVGVPLSFLSGRDLANFPARIGWLFNYDYVNVPVTGRPWPVTSVYGDRYEYGVPLYGFAIAAALFTALLALPAGKGAVPPAAPSGKSWTRERVLLFALLFAGLLAVGIAVGPAEARVAAFSIPKLPYGITLPPDLRWVFLVPALIAGLWLLGPLLLHGSRLRSGVTAFALFAVLSTTFILDRILIDLSPHWSQKHVFATYYRLRKGPEEPVVAWMMYWRGENLYTSNQIYDHRIDAAEKTVFLGDRNTEKLQTYLNNHRGRRVFFLIERHRLESLRGLLPEAARPSLKVVDDSNNKVYLASAQL